MAPGAKKNLAPPCSNLRSFGSKCSVLKKNCGTLLGLFGAPVIRHPRHCVPLPPSLRIWCDTSRQCARCEILRALIVEPLLQIDCPTRNWRGKFCWLNTRESGPEVVQGLVGVTTSPTLLGPLLLWNQQNYLKLLLTVKYSKSS